MEIMYAGKPIDLELNLELIAEKLAALVGV